MNDTAIPSWREMVEQQLLRHEHLPHSRFVQAATVRANGMPANRTLTFRFFTNKHLLLFTTDARSEKVAALNNNPWAELCWYFTESRMQFRLSGRMHVSDGTDSSELTAARYRTWQERSEESRQSFTWPVPGQPLEMPSAFSCSAPALPPDNFALLIFAPERVDVLDLACTPHARTVHENRHGNWTNAAINP